MKYPFHLTYFLSPLFMTFSTLLICHLQFVFIKRFNNFFSNNSFWHICSWNSIFKFFNNKIFFRSICRVTFCKNIFLFWYSYMVTNLKFRIFLRSKSIYVFEYISTSFILIILCYMLLYLLTVSFNLSIYTFLDIEDIFVDFVLYFSNKYFSKNRFFLIMCWIHSYIIILQPWFQSSNVKFTAFIYP